MGAGGRKGRAGCPTVASAGWLCSLVSPSQGGRQGCPGMEWQLAAPVCPAEPGPGLRGGGATLPPGPHGVRPGGGGEASRVATELGSGHQGACVGPGRERSAPSDFMEQSQLPVGSGGFYGILYRPRAPYLPSWWRPVPAVGGEFCRLYRNRPPIFLQLSDFVNWDYTDRRKVF